MPRNLHHQFIHYVYYMLLGLFFQDESTGFQSDHISTLSLFDQCFM